MFDALCLRGFRQVVGAVSAKDQEKILGLCIPIIRSTPSFLCLSVHICLFDLCFWSGFRVKFFSSESMSPFFVLFLR